MNMYAVIRWNIQTEEIKTEIQSFETINAFRVQRPTTNRYMKSRTFDLMHRMSTLCHTATTTLWKLRYRQCSSEETWLEKRTEHNNCTHIIKEWASFNRIGTFFQLLVDTRGFGPLSSRLDALPHGYTADILTQREKLERKKDGKEAWKLECYRAWSLPVNGGVCGMGIEFLTS